MAKASTGYTARRPSNGDPNTEEAFQISDDRLNALESLIRPGESDAPYDDTGVKNLIRNLRRDMEEHTHRRRNATAGDTYAGQFKVTYPGSGESVDISDGYVLFPGSELFEASSLPIDITNGTHYVYMRVYREYGAWSAEILEATSVPGISVDDNTFLIAQIDVVDDAIDDSTLIQHNYGAIQNPPGSKSTTYRGPFQATKTEVVRRVAIYAGDIVTGTTTTAAVSQNVNVSSSVGIHFVYFEVSYSGGVSISLEESTSFPSQTDLVERFVVAEVDILDGAITDIRQVQHGNFSSSRVWD
jgi:hypothetical protein